MTALSEIVAIIRMDMADMDAELFDDVLVRRAIERSLITLNADLGTGYVFQGIGTTESVAPDLQQVHLEMATLLAQGHLAMRMKNQHAESIKFESGDKSADLTPAFKQWQATEKNLRQLYKDQLLRLRPNLDDSLLPITHSVRIYEQGSAQGDMER